MENNKICGKQATDFAGLYLEGIKLSDMFFSLGLLEQGHHGTTPGFFFTSPCKGCEGNLIFIAGVIMFKDEEIRASFVLLLTQVQQQLLANQASACQHQ